jgi:hypothetical protein
MKPLPVLLAFLLAASANAADKAKPVVYCVQLIRATEDSRPPVPGSKQIDPKLDKCLHSAFKFKNFWEINRREVPIAAGKKAMTRLTSERQVEIDLTEPGKRKVTAFDHGKSVFREVRPLGRAATIIGGDHDSQSVWLIIVRRGEPEH